MRKRILALILCLAMLFAALPLGVSAAGDKHADMYQQVRSVYRKTLRSSGKSSMDGYCGVMASHELYHLGITKYAEIYNGKDHFDAFAKQDVTSGGYKVTAYPASDYTLEGALNTITAGGTRDAYNILVGFQWSKNGLGQQYGHVVVIHAILDGVVYSVENSYSDLAGSEGTPIVCSIAEFAKEYDAWTVLDGVISFGTKEYADFCVSFDTDVFITAESRAAILSQPCAAGENGCAAVRAVQSGERLHATGVYTSTDDTVYYQVGEGYISADEVSLLRCNTDGIIASGMEVPAAVELGKDPKIGGHVVSANSMLGTVEVTVEDSTGEPLLQGGIYRNSHSFDLDEVNKVLDLSLLDTGVYTLSVYADAWNYYEQDGAVQMQAERVRVYTADFAVGGAVLEKTAERAVFSAEMDGWIYDSGVWYCYRDGLPRTGWYCYDGIDYYLKEDGSVTTGWANINGQDRYFSATGAMRTGWLDTENGRMYMLSNGVAAHGFREVDGALYCFGEDGVMLTGQTVSDGVTAYALDASGVATAVN